MFKKILIANRGEIACRVIRTARSMGIKTVAVYSDADARAPHVKLADESVRLGPPPASESYLKAELIIDACKATGAEAVHPGYGFLSERESFAKALDKADIAFIGPPPKAIRAMGDKIESKKLAAEAGVNVVPGHLEDIATTGEAVKIAKDIGFPVMMKASAGGGGKGMRLAWNEKDVREGFDSVKREGLNSFGDDRVFIEKFIEAPRHIEIQVLGDQHGSILYLNERECSIQRRNQKVVEEAPSPFVSPEMRKAMGEQAVALARAVGYYSAGTVELIVNGADPSGKSFYFLEMNTRLQVEHPVTEEITGLDLVEQMIRVAAGEKLKFKQDDIGINGWAVETRIYAEDPYRSFLPSTGRLVRYWPSIQKREDDLVVRVDDGVVDGGEVSMFYDPMIAKLVTWAPTREAAIDAQVDALDQFVIDGISDNVDFLSALMQHPRFRKGISRPTSSPTNIPKASKARRRTSSSLPMSLSSRAWSRSSLTSARSRSATSSAGVSTCRASGWCGSTAAPSTRYESSRTRAGRLRLWTMATSSTSSGAGSRASGCSTVLVDGRKRTVQVRRAGRNWELQTRGASHKVQVLNPHVAELSKHMIEKQPPDLSRLLLAPMPGLLTKLEVKVGDKVEPGQPVAVMEAMKMENILRAPKAARVKATPARAGDSVAVDQVIVEFE